MRILATIAAMTLFLMLLTSVSAFSSPSSENGQGDTPSRVFVPEVLSSGGDRPIDVSSLTVMTSSGEIVYPSVQTVLRVKVLNQEPVKVTLYPDSTIRDMYLSFNSPNVFTGSESLRGIIEIKSSSTYMFNKSTNAYEVDFSVVFDWDAPFADHPTVDVVAIDSGGNEDELSVDSAYTLERRLLLDGELSVQSTDPKALSHDGSFIKGGAFLVMKGLSLHFFGDPIASPDPSGFVITVTDDRRPADTWEYRAARSSDLNRISFSFQMPYCDQRLNFSMKVTVYPSGAVPKGQIDFSIVIDSTSPKVYDFRTENVGKTVLSWEYEEVASGIDISSFMLRLERAQPKQVVDWFIPSEVAWTEGKVKVSLALDPGSYSVQIRLSDMVDNVNRGSDDLRYYFSTAVKPVHDIAIESEPKVDPNPLVAGYITTFAYTIVNKGTSAESDIPLLLSVDGAPLAVDQIDDLPAGSTVEMRFQWVPVSSARILKLEIDPDMVLSDDDLTNNVITTELVVHHRDLSIDPATLTSSDPMPEDMEIVTLNLKVECLGDLDSGLVRLMVFQDGIFYGNYTIMNIPAGTWELFSFEWKASYKVQRLKFLLDPYNDITESVEDNDIEIANPFYVGTSDDIGDTGEDGQSDPTSGPITDGSEGNQDSNPGQTIWIGPETGEVEYPGGPTTTEVIPTIPIKRDENGPPSLTLPLIGFTITSTMLAGVLLALRNEVLRYKMMMIAIPLYSKLKKEKIEQGTRFEILGYLKARPGASYTEIKEILDLNDGSLIHHLRVLEREDKIYSKKVSKYKLFYVTSYKRRPSLGDYVSPFQRRILELVYSNPGIVPNKLSKMLDRSQTDISYHLAELSRNGFLEKRKRGRNIQYYINDEYLDVMMS